MIKAVMEVKIDKRKYKASLTLDSSSEEAAIVLISHVAEMAKQQIRSDRKGKRNG